MNNHKSGFTLVEILVAMAVASIVMTVVYVIYASYSKSYTVQEVTAEVQQDIRAGLELMICEIRMAGYAPTSGDDFGIEEASGTKFGYTRDTNIYNGTLDIEAGTRERITYLYDAGQLVRITNEGDASFEDRRVLLDNVSAFSFSYFDDEDNNLGSPVALAALGDIKGVNISVTLQESASLRGGIVSRTLTQFILCRNIGL